MTFDLRALQHFLAIHRQGGFARAARQLRVSQPTLSRSIATLEQQLSTQLFERSTKGTLITAEGLRLLPHATMIIDEVERAQALFESPATESFTQIRLGISPNLLDGNGAQAIGQMIAGDGRLHAVIHTATMEALIDQVKSGEITFAVCLIVTRLLQNISKYEGCAFEEIGRDTIYPVARPDHPVFAGPVALADMCDHDWAVPHQLSVSYRFESVFFRQDLPLPRERLNTSSMALMKTAIRDWGMIGLMPVSIIAPELAGDTMRIVDIKALAFDYSVAIIRPASLILSPEVTAAMSLVRKVIGGQDL